ncbi:peroxiredoxin [Microbulbifer hydrolyticus]|uniref:Peroxiredoxin Q/BCP n=1 Tax=Microbulbifer hydrolyticus TaxID=48074 RepID=A0A6P1T8L0_9GAMM|nr:peroxiredoxin [Microbulbifer hydrolyticus]MBB5211264.1 peroxiredoxin Q/BCP [Microbulbifer hydrolyticus]QHQ37970.1 redoxin domain-containing protein [Microbulbifer hydrolyticus]
MRKLFLLLAMVAIVVPAYALEVGDKAPDFSLQGTDGKTYTLSDFNGKQAVVIAWYPKAFTKGCTIECKSLAENGHLIREYDVTYFMASTDEVEDNTKFAEEQKADFPLLSDPSGEVAEAYDVKMPVLNMAKRVTIYIGKDGTVLKIDRDIKPATSAQDMASTLGELGVAKKG